MRSTGPRRTALADSPISSVPTTRGMLDGRNGATAMDITVAKAGTPSLVRGPKKASNAGGHS